MRFPRIALAVALAAAWGTAGAADLLSVYRDALVSDSTYQAARAQYNALRERSPQARAGYLPIITGTAGTFRNDIDFEIAADRQYSTYNYGVTLSQPVLRMQNWIAISQADKLVLQAEANLAFQGEELAIRVAQAYFDVLLAQDNVALSGAQKVAISEQLAQAKRNFEVGTSTIVDTLEAQARYDQSVAKEIADINDLEVRKRWDAYQKAYGFMLAHTGTPYAPWTIVPADSKTHRNLMIATVVRDTLAGLGLRFPPAKKGVAGVRVA